ncbi:HAMP domain-containing protein [Moritella sp. 24]|uniref:ATP-binding protein n=1 Tax=Moritella sp. 24 TaxID=2746230 RepID=UPI001BF15F22|nr:ATP-binding protein [Moritella sp. 24]QUM74944.1 HAMP domain-containing protein [Moritella sp. 24]
MLLLVVAVVIALPTLDSRIMKQLDPRSVNILNSIAHNIATSAERYPNIPLQVLITPKEAQTKHFYLVRANGEIISSTKASKAIRRFILQSEESLSPKVKQYKNWLMTGPIPVNLRGEPFQFYAAQQLPAEHNIWLINVLDRPFLLLFITMFVSMPLCASLAWHISKPLQNLQKTASDITDGNLDAVVPATERQDEIGELARSLRTMMFSIREHISLQHRLLSDISHELRSPLTRLKMSVALSKRRYGETKEIVRIDNESERLEEMIAALLNLSKTQLNATTKESFNLDSLLQPICDDAIFEAEQLEKNFSHQAIPDLNIKGFPALFGSAIENVIRNALRYASNQVNLAVISDMDKITFVITDDGPGVPEDEIEQIFKPFYRVSQARDRESGGAGLGLAITENAIRQHHGVIVASNREVQGLQIAITIPMS